MNGFSKQEGEGAVARPPPSNLPPSKQAGGGGAPAAAAAGRRDGGGRFRSGGGGFGQKFKLSVRNLFGISITYVNMLLHVYARKATFGYACMPTCVPTHM